MLNGSALQLKSLIENLFSLAVDLQEKKHVFSNKMSPNEQGCECALTHTKAQPRILFSDSFSRLHV